MCQRRRWPLELYALTINALAIRKPSNSFNQSSLSARQHLLYSSALKLASKMPASRTSLESHLSRNTAITRRTDSPSVTQLKDRMKLGDGLQARGRTVYNYSQQAPLSQPTGDQCRQDSRIQHSEDSFQPDCTLHDKHDVRIEILEQLGFESARSLEEYLISIPNSVTPSAVFLSLTQSSKKLDGGSRSPSMGRLSDEEALKVADELFHMYIDKTVFYAD
ncbi:hypothetical protein CPB83DRAFT_6404 [Crepidotus variabilis]|uniref:Uncharacterized protein n=1 Tax=Crepidotus variabilis TaxID=179855 RepID=A0A9P6EUY1_9AGAR|nr:hypothetical protein CPB83DRAFT_6404 [Crepidotus variabilis]